MTNQFSFNLTEDYLAHGQAHLSKNWTAQKQKEYNHWYYLHKVKGKLDQISDPITGNYTQGQIARLEQNNEWIRKDAHNTWTHDNEYSKNRLQKLNYRYDNNNEEIKQLKDRYYNHTLEGKIKSIPDKAQNAVWDAEDKMRDVKEKITGSKAKKSMAENRKKAETYKSWNNSDMAKYYNVKYSDAKKAYESSVFGATSNAIEALSKMFKK